MKLLLTILMLFVSISGWATTLNGEFKKLKINTQIKFLTNPTRSESSDFELRFFKGKKSFIPKQKVMSYLWMNMGEASHGSAPLELNVKKDHIKVTNVWFVMLGTWELHVALKVDGKEVDKVIFKVPIRKGQE